MTILYALVAREKCVLAEHTGTYIIFCAEGGVMCEHNEVCVCVLRKVTSIPRELGADTAIPLQCAAVVYIHFDSYYINHTE